MENDGYWCHSGSKKRSSPLATGTHSSLSSPTALLYEWTDNPCNPLKSLIAASVNSRGCSSHARWIFSKDFPMPNGSKASEMVVLTSFKTSVAGRASRFFEEALMGRVEESGKDISSQRQIDAAPRVFPVWCVRWEDSAFESQCDRRLMVYVHGHVQRRQQFVLRV